MVNWLPLVGHNNVIDACGQIDFAKFGNIDKVYLDNPYSGKVQLVYDRAAYAAFQPDGEPSQHLEPLFILWLTDYLYKLRPPAYRPVQQIAERERSIMWLPAHAREQLVAWGEKFLERGELDEVLWIIERCKAPIR